MFDELVRAYGDRLTKIPAEDRDAFIASEKDAAARRSIQETLLKELGAQAQEKQAEEKKAAGTLNTRIELIKTQLSLTQGRQELELNKREVTFLLDKLGKIEASTSDKMETDPAAEKLQAMLADIESRLKGLELGQTETAIGRLKAAIPRTSKAPADVLPKDNAPLDPEKHTAAALAVQQENLLRCSLGSPGFEQAVSKPKARTSAEALGKKGKGEIPDWRASMGLAARMVAAHQLEKTVADKRGATVSFEARLADIMGRIEAADLQIKASTVEPDKLRPLRADVMQFVGDVQWYVQNALTQATKRNEKVKQDKLVDEAVAQWLAKPDGELTKGMGPLLTDLFKQAGSMEKLLQAIGDHDKRPELEQALAFVRDLKRNDVVQGFFLLKKGSESEGTKDALANEGDSKDAGFFAATESAKGDYNFYANLGKYTYHVTALANILRKAGSGISKTGLSPGRGGLSGGSCEIADTSTNFNGTSVNIKDASVVNSQNKVAASSNRQDAMQVYITQREDAADKLIKLENDAAKAAQESTIMLRFPIRAEYLGKFDKDPIHLTDNLQLLDGTPVPPDDIELLVHRDWVPITNEAFQEVYQEMFSDMLKS